jgi:hypothetical protein
MDAKSIALERSESLLSNDVLNIVVHILQRELLGFEKAARLDFDLHFFLSHFLV